MQVFDLKKMKAFPYEERERNVFYETNEFKARITELAPGGEIPFCEMKSHVVFYVIEGAAEVKVDQEKVTLEEGQCLITGPATISMKSRNGVKILGIAITEN